MTLFEGEQNGRYETDHLHMVLNEHIDFTEEGLSDDRKYSIFVHEYVHYYQHFATLYGSQFCQIANLLFIETEQEEKQPSAIFRKITWIKFITWYGKNRAEHNKPE